MRAVPPFQIAAGRFGRVRRFTESARAQLGFMGVTVAGALFLTPLLGILAAHLYDETAALDARHQAVDERARAELVGFGFVPLYGEAAARLTALVGVELLIAERDFRIDLAPAPLAGTPADHAATQRFSDIVSRELGRYPRSFVRASRLRRVVVCAGLREGRQPITSLPNVAGTLFLDTDVPDDFARRLVHHELHHFADFADDDHLGNDAAWESLNDHFFVYGDGGRFMREPNAGRIEVALPGFVTRYATSAVEEDKAEVFSLLMTAPREVARVAAFDVVIARKIALVKKRASALSPDMDDAFWSGQRDPGAG